MLPPSVLASPFGKEILLLPSCRTKKKTLNPICTTTSVSLSNWKAHLCQPTLRIIASGQQVLFRPPLVLCCLRISGLPRGFLVILCYGNAHKQSLREQACSIGIFSPYQDVIRMINVSVRYQLVCLEIPDSAALDYAPYHEFPASFRGLDQACICFCCPTSGLYTV